MCHIGDSRLGSVPSHKGQRSASVENRHAGLWGMYGRFGTTPSVRPGTPGSTIKGTIQRQISNIRDTIWCQIPRIRPLAIFVSLTPVR